jgi:hypothetical protein
MRSIYNVGRVYADDTPTGAATGTPEEETGIATPAPEANAVPSEPAPTPATVQLSAEELDVRIERGIMSAVQKLQERAAAGTPRPSTTNGGAARESLSLLKESTKMNTEALTLYPDLPEEYRAKIESQLEQIEPEQIAAFRRSGLHKTIANAVMAEAINDGKYTPKRFVQPATPHREPTGGGTPSLNSTDPEKAAFNREIDELETLLGSGLTSAQRAQLKLTPQERDAAYGRR